MQLLCEIFSACFKVQDIFFPARVYSARLFLALRAERCQGIAQQVDKGARQSPRHFNPKRLDCFIYKVSLGSGLCGASRAKGHGASFIDRNQTDLKDGAKKKETNVTVVTAEQLKGKMKCM